jgi:hypothetical protein
MYYHRKKRETQECESLNQKMNELIKKALLAYDEEDYQKFFEELSNEYKSGSRLLKLMCPGDYINHENIINELIKYGFKPDLIAYLLILISEVLISGKIKIQRMTSDDLKTQGYQVLHGVLSKRLEKKARDLDHCCIQELQKKILKSRKNPEILKIKDSIKTHFVSSLEEMRDIAKIDLMICDILKGGPEEIKRVKETFKKVQESINSNHQYIGMAEIRLEACDDLFWIISGESIPNDFAND